jgi:hypothetical protein
VNLPTACGRARKFPLIARNGYKFSGIEGANAERATAPALAIETVADNNQSRRLRERQCQGTTTALRTRHWKTSGFWKVTNLVPKCATASAASAVFAATPQWSFQNWVMHQ